MLRFAGIFLLSFAPMLMAQGSTVTKRASGAKAEDNGMQEAIRFESLKARQDTLQARKERLNPTTYNYYLDRRGGGASTVKDPGPVKYKRRQISH